DVPRGPAAGAGAVFLADRRAHRLASEARSRRHSPDLPQRSLRLDAALFAVRLSPRGGHLLPLAVVAFAPEQIRRRPRSVSTLGAAAPRPRGTLGRLGQTAG